MLYVLDEPSIGLHQRDNRRLIETLTKMKRNLKAMDGVPVSTTGRKGPAPAGADGTPDQG